MVPFVHGHLAKVQALLVEANSVSREVLAQTPNAGDQLASLLQRGAQAYADLGQTQQESQWLSLRLNLQAARRPTLPTPGAPRRRDLERAATLEAVQACAELLRTDTRQQTQQLAEAREMLSPILLAALQKQLVPDSPAGPRLDTAFVDALWPRLCAEPDLRLACQRVALAHSLYDIRLLLLDMLYDMAQGSAQPPPAPAAAPEQDHEPMHDHAQDHSQDHAHDHPAQPTPTPARPPRPARRAA